MCKPHYILGLKLMASRLILLHGGGVHERHESSEKTYTNACYAGVGRRLGRSICAVRRAHLDVMAAK